MMKLGTQLGFGMGLGMTDTQLYEIMVQMGFESVDYSLMDGYRSPLWQLSDQELKQKMNNARDVMYACGVYAGQTHSPLDNIWRSDTEAYQLYLHSQIQAIKAASFLGSPHLVIHPLLPDYRRNKKGIEETKELNMSFFKALRPYLEEYGVNCAIECMDHYDPVLGRSCECACSTVKEMKDYIDTLGNDVFSICLDVGHCVLGGNDPATTIYELGSKYLHATHIHDNNYLEDEHLMPGLGKLDWYGIGKALNDIGYQYVFNYEADFAFLKWKGFQNRKTLQMDMMRLFAELGKAIINVK